MKLKIFLRGLGVGIVFSALIMLICTSSLSKEFIMDKAREYGMVIPEESQTDKNIDKLKDEMSANKGTKTPEATKVPDSSSSAIPTESNPPSDVTEPTKEPMPTNQPEETKKPTVTEEPLVTKEPTVTKQPEKTKEPTVTKQPEKTKEPTVTKEPEKTKEPTVTKEPEKTKEPTVTKEPEKTKEPTVTKEPEKTKEPTVTKEPEKTKVPEGENVAFTIDKGTSYSAAKVLEQCGLVDDAKKFDSYLCQNGLDGHVKAGKFKAKKGMTYAELAKIITRK